MQKREKLLAILAVVLVLLAGGNWIAKILWAPISARESQVDTLRGEIRQARATLGPKKVLDEKYDQWTRKSLPSNLSRAQTKYLDWLNATLAGVNLAHLGVEPSSSRPIVLGTARRGVGEISHHVLTFVVKGNVTLENLSDFLYRFYQQDLLHRVTNLTVNANSDGKTVDVSITIEALSLPDATESDELPSGKVNRVALASEQAYKDILLGRNLFGPPNHPPEFAKIAEQTAHPARQVSLTLAAKDQDEKDKLKYSIQDAPEGATIDETTGEFKWTPPEDYPLGAVVATVAVSDDGVPSLKSEEKIKFNVVEAPAQSVVAREYEHAKQTFITGVTESNEIPLVWLHIRTKNIAHFLKEGQSFEVDEMKATITRIGTRDREIEIEADGSRWTWPWDKSLYDAIQSRDEGT